MDRRSFLKQAAFGALAAPASLGAAHPAPLAVPAVHASRVREVTLATPFAPRPGGLSDSVFRFARRLEAASGSTIKIILIEGTDQSSRLPNGADFFMALEHASVGVEPALAYVAGLPGTTGLSAEALAVWLDEAGGQAEWDRSAAVLGMKKLLVGHTAGTGRLWLRSSRTTLSGARVAVDGLAADVVKGVGAEAVALTADEAGDSLSRGDIDAVEVAGFEDGVTLGLHGVPAWSAAPPLYAGGSALSLSIPLTVWEGLGTDAQRILFDAARRHYAESVAEARHHANALAAMTARPAGAAAVAASAFAALPLQRVSEAVVAEVASRNANTRRMSAHFRRFRERASLAAAC